ncbi:MAG: LysR substrate-binding domain-containing protein, partial [Alcanivorax sp.]|nr:LysR substrate-binding domain-containing protein [Alcanivorax sp.]
RVAPGIDLQSVMVPRREMAQELAAGRLDLALDVQIPAGADIEQAKVVDATLMVLMRRDNPLAAGDLDMAQYLAARHVLVSSRRRGPGLEDFGLAQLGYRRELGLRCQHWQAALEVVASSDLLVTVPDMLAQRLAPPDRFAVRPMPVPLPSMGLHLYWHRDQSGDEGHRWLREQFLQRLQVAGTGKEE